MSKPLTIAVAGLGTVGAGVIRVLDTHADLLTRRCGRELKVVAVSARDRSKDRGIVLETCEWYDDAAEMARKADAEVVIELIGGSGGIAKSVVDGALDAGRHVVTANKALLAHHGTELARAAERAGVALAYEAAVAGGIPIIKALREGLAANSFDRVYGILNGTCNYILSAMRETGRGFDEVLAEAQELGYAEADPAFDIDGVDTAHKLAILASLAFGTEVDFDSIYTEGIRHVSPLDFEFAEELGYRIKLLGIARRTPSGIEQRVHPCMVPLADPIAHIEDVFNAVVVDGDAVETTMYEGRGAGEGPTASAVVADVVDIARGRTAPAFGVPCGELTAPSPAPITQRTGRYYLRLTVVDRPGVFAEIASALKENNVSMEAIIQRGRAPGEAVEVVLTTHETRDDSVAATIDAIAESDAVLEPTRLIRIVSFG